MSAKLYSEEELEQECLRRMRLATERYTEIIDKQRADLERIETDIVAMRLTMRGLVAERAHLTITINEYLNGKDALRAAEILGENAAHKLIELSKKSFRDHARMHEMKSYIHYLQNHARNCGVRFTDLGENNDGKRDIFADSYSPHSYTLPSIKP